VYKYLLCWRYLRTRYIALASVVSVMLGVATLIVVNSVMAGFADLMRTRLHGIMADVVVDARSFNGFNDPDQVMARIKEVAGDDVVAMAPAVQTVGILSIPIGGSDEMMTREVQVIGVRAAEREKTGDFATFLQDEKGKKVPASFAVDDAIRGRTRLGQVLASKSPDDPMYETLKADMDAAMPPDGIILGHALGVLHQGHDGFGKPLPDFAVAGVGRKVILSFAGATRPPKAVSDSFTVTGLSKTGMSEYDSTHVYVELERLQYLRGQGTGPGAPVNQIQIRARPGVDLDVLTQTLDAELSAKWPLRFKVETWEQKQGPLLAAVAVEQSILNILLFFIIAVAGFGILAIFSMIVVEKTRDIGILKALGASTSGVRGIFLGYGLLLGVVGSGVGMAAGLGFVAKINAIEHWLSKVTGRKVFDDAIYYFSEIPTRVVPFTVAWVVGGALLIAVAASIIPAQRASRLRPVQALRFE